MKEDKENQSVPKAEPPEAVRIECHDGVTSTGMAMNKQESTFMKETQSVQKAEPQEVAPKTDAVPLAESSHGDGAFTNESTIHIPPRNPILRMPRFVSQRAPFKPRW